MSGRSLPDYYAHRAKLFASRVKTYSDHRLVDLCWRTLPSQEYTHVLDLAAGQGHFVNSLFGGQVPDVLFFDLSNAMLQEGIRRQLIPAGRAVCGNVDTGLPFSDNTFNLVVCRYAWHDFGRQVFVAQEIARVLVEMGVFLFVDMSLPRDDARLVSIYSDLHSLKTKLPTRIVSLPHLESQLAEQGMKLLSHLWYQSQVTLRDWIDEGQLTLQDAQLLFRAVVGREQEFSEIGTMAIDTAKTNIEFTFPVLVAAFVLRG